MPDRPVVYIMGNHEAYGGDIDRAVEKAKAAARNTNVHVLQSETVQIGGITFAGATLWTDFALCGDQRRAMAVAAEHMNDFRKIRTARYMERFRPYHAYARHLAARKFFEGEMRKPRSGKLVVVSHHAPHPGRALPLSDPTGHDEILAAAYRSDLRFLMSSAPDDGFGALRPADVWIYGHTHESEDTVIGQTRVVSNAKGYGPWLPKYRTWENPRFDPNLVIEI
ncbi:metallophosphoesterase [Bradyrhizobium sp. AS23.2]|uniref:metallophosphoesterase n=1 Tax=Bradyrhizobium sp. AS23.2 TaxID=1680155 RepID=UPI001FD96ECF|nr:metallophosphoesterase [Bradyrhizobium sp. AS23.2]